MSLCNRFVLWVYLGLADSLPTGRDAAARIFDLAHRQGRLLPGSLNDLSILLLLAVCPLRFPLWTAADQQASQRNLYRQPDRVWQLLQTIRFPRITELLEMCRHRVPHLRAALSNVLCSPRGPALLTELCTFLGRLLLISPEEARNQALPLLIQATTTYYRVPLGIVDFLVRLYRHVLLSFQLESHPLPSALPAGEQPAWLTALEPDERQVLERSLDSLSEPDVVLLALHFHAHLSAEQIATVLQAGEPTWNADRVVRRVEQCWNAIL